jgi:hypothetical protein
VFRRGSTGAAHDPDDDAMGTLSALTFDLLIVVVFAAVVYIALRVAQSIFGTSSKKAAATEVAAKLVSYPTALTAQHVVMPSGERLAFSDLTVRVAPEDLERLDPDGDLDRLGEDGARLYAAHAERTGWAVPRQVRVTVEVDPGLRSGWIPPARGTGRADPAQRDRRPAVGWDAVPAAAEVPAAPQRPAPRLDPAATASFPALVPDLDDAPTMNVASGLRLERNGRTYTIGRAGAVLGRLPESPVTFAEPEVSFRHAAIRLQGVQWQVKDLGSTNGTTLDGQRIDGDDWTTIHAGAVLALAGVRVTAALDRAGTVHLQGLTRH